MRDFETLVLAQPIPPGLLRQFAPAGLVSPNLPITESYHGDISFQPFGPRGTGNAPDAPPEIIGDGYLAAPPLFRRRHL